MDTNTNYKLVKRCLALLSVVVLTGGTVTLFGQTQKGTILGTITDTSGAVIPSAAIVITETRTNVARTSPTNESGFFAFPNLDPGNYQVQVEHEGFQKLTRSGIDLAADTTVRVDIELPPGASTQTIQVTDTTPELKTDRADTGGTIQREVQNIPTLNNRNYQNLMMLLPGIQIAYNSGSAFFNSQEHLQSVVNGLDKLNNYLIEGVDNNVENLSGVVPPADSIQSVDVTTSNYDPEFGRAGGAVTNVILKSGTNDFHGEVFEYHRDGNLQARPDFSNKAPHVVYNQYGGALGGRIKADKLFFFGDYQGTRSVSGLSNNPTIPTMAFRTGDLSASPTTIYDPRTGNADGTGRLPFAGNIIPQGRISSIAQRLLSFIPSPNLQGLSANFIADTVQHKTIQQYDSKVDYLITGNDRISVRYSYQSANVFDPGLYGPDNGIYGGPHNQGFSGSGPALNQSPGLNYSHIFGPTLVTEVRFGVVRSRNDALNIDTGLNTTKDVGIPGVNLGAWSSGLTNINVAGYDAPMLGYSSNLPWHRAVTNFDVVNNWTKVKGTHVVKWGISIIRERQDLMQARGIACCSNPRGQFTFTSGPTSLNGNSKNGFANAFAAFLLDQPNTIGISPAPSIFPARRNSTYALYVQDKWQVKRKLTVDLGLRWEYSPSSTPHFPGGFSNYNLSNNTLELAGIGSIPMNQGITNNLAKSWAPRLGLAYRLDEKTVFRGGFGISYLPHVTYAYNYPVQSVIELDPINSFGAAGSMSSGVPPVTPIATPTSGIITNPPLNYVYTNIAKNNFHTYVESWNFAIQRALPSNFSVEAAYVGNHGVDIGVVANYNASRIPGSGTASEPLNILFHRTAETDLGSTNGLGGLGESSNYHAFQARLNRKFSSGFVLTTSYTFSKGFDYNSSTSPGATPGTIFNNIDLNANRSLSTWNRPHVFTQSGTYELPFGQGKRWAKSGAAKMLAGGWQLSGLWTWESGNPLDIQISATSLNAPGNGNRPNVNGPVQIYGNVGPGRLYFDTSMFSAPAANTFGNVGRNILHGPGVFDIDMSLVRKFRITERINVDVRADSFDVSNTARYDNPGTTFGTPNFGQVTTNQAQNVAVKVSRLWQFSLRLAF